jgi:hypothetical protein
LYVFLISPSLPTLLLRLMKSNKHHYNISSLI